MRIINRFQNEEKLMTILVTHIYDILMEILRREACIHLRHDNNSSPDSGRDLSSKHRFNSICTHDIIYFIKTTGNRNEGNNFPFSHLPEQSHPMT